MANKGFKAKRFIIKPIMDIDCITFDSNSKNAQVFIRKGKQYNSPVLPKQKSFKKLPF